MKGKIIDLVEVEEQFRGIDKDVLKKILPTFVEVVIEHNSWYVMLDAFLRKYESGGYEDGNKGVKIIIDAISKNFEKQFCENFFCKSDFKTIEQQECFLEILHRSYDKKLGLSYRDLLCYLISFTGFSITFKSDLKFDKFNLYVIEKILIGWKKGTDDSTSCLLCIDKIYWFLAGLEKKYSKMSFREHESIGKYKRKIINRIHERIRPEFWKGEDIECILKGKNDLHDDIWSTIFRGLASSSMDYTKELRKKYR